MSFLLSLIFLFLVPVLVLWRAIKRIIELKKRCLIAPIIGVLSLTLASLFFLMMVSLNKGVSSFDLLRNPREYFFYYKQYLFSFALGILPMITIFLYGNKEFFLSFSKQKLVLIPLLFLCILPPSLVGAGFYYGILDVVPLFDGDKFPKAFFLSSDYPLGLFIFGALLIAYFLSIFLFISFYLSRKYKLLNYLIITLVLISSFYFAESKTLTGKEIEDLFNKARITGDVEWCKKIIGEPINIRLKQYECIKEVAIMKQDESLCEELPYFYEKKKVGTYYECYEEIAKIKKDPSLCKNWRCYYELAPMVMDLELCNKIPDEYNISRNECILKTRGFIEQKREEERQRESSLLPDLVIKDFYYKEGMIYTEYCNIGDSVSMRTFLIKTESDTGTFLGNAYYPFSTPKPGECRLTGGLGIGLIGIKEGDIKEIVQTIDWENKVKESDEENNILKKTIEFYKLDNQCIDSDGGKNYYIKGEAHVWRDSTSIGFIDCCKKDTTGGKCEEEAPYLYEAMCENNKPTIFIYECPKGCRNGICVE